VETHGTARQATDDNTTWCLCFACLMTTATDTHTEYVILVLAAFHGTHVFANVPGCYLYLSCCNLNGECLLRGTNWVFKQNILCFVIKMLTH